MTTSADTPTHSSRPHAQRIAAWAHAIRFAEAPPSAQQALRNCLLYNLTMGLAVDPADDELGNVLGSVALCPGNARLFGGRGTRSAQDAAFINAGLITSRGQNDTHPDVVTHIGCIVIPAVLALADESASPLPDVMDAILTGYEVIPRVAQALSAESSRRGFRATAIYGVIGAAVAAARLMRLSAGQTANALSIATHHACGIMQTWIDGSQEWRLQVAKASKDGVTAALLARAGMQGSPGCLDGAGGYAQAYAGGGFTFDPTGWKMPEVAFKPYPGCAFNQSPVHALRQLLRNNRIDPRQVASVDVYMNPFDANYPGIVARGPFSSPAGAIMSAPFMLAATLEDGLPRIAHFQDHFQHSPLHARSRAIHVHADDAVKRWQCRISATTASGAVHGLAFDEPQPFVFDWRQTLELCRNISGEWPGIANAARFDVLAHAIGRLNEDADLCDLQSAVYAA